MQRKRTKRYDLRRRNGKTQEYTTYLKLLPRRRRRLHCEETLVCVLLPQPPSAAAIAGREREEKEEGTVWGRMETYGDGICYGQEGIRAGKSNHGPHITGSNR